MQETFYFDSVPQPYRAEAAVVWRFDDRITLAVQKFLKRRNFLHVDSFRVAGGAKALASPGNEAEHQFLIDQTGRSEEHTSELQSPCNLVCRLLLEKKKKKKT